MKKDFNIAIISPSAIVTEGLKFILKGSERHSNVDRYPLIGDILGKESSSYDIVIIDSEALQNSGKSYYKIGECFSDSITIGLVTTAISREFSELCQEVIYMDDSPMKVAEVIDKSIKSHSGGHRMLSENPLSEREREVLKLLVKGDTAKEIASKLFISTHTVVTHRKNISAKLGIRTTSAMAIYAVSANLVSLDDILDSIPNNDEEEQ